MKLMQHVIKQPDYGASTWRTKRKCSHAHDRHEPEYKRYKDLLFQILLTFSGRDYFFEKKTKFKNQLILFFIQV